MGKGMEKPEDKDTKNGIGEQGGLGTGTGQGNLDKQK